MKTFQKRGTLALCLFLSFTLWTILLRIVDVRPIGPRGSAVGFSTINGWFHSLTDTHFSLYNITDWLGLVPIAIAFGFAVLGLVQWIARRGLFRVDCDLFLLGGFYILTIAAYLLFESVVINYRPVLINGYLEVSYPSSTTLLVLCVIPTAVLQLRDRIRSTTVRRIVVALLLLFLCFMVIGRLVSGVHWLTDIIGGALLSAALVETYRAFHALLGR